MDKNMPSSVFIAGIEWTIKTTDKHANGFFDGRTHTIEIGTKNKKDIPNIFLHEIIEAIITERGFRWRMYPDTNEKLLFCFDHAQFENLVRDLALALRDVLAI